MSALDTTNPYGLPVVRPAAAVEVAAPGGLRAAMAAASTALDVAEQLGLPDPLGDIAVSGGRIEARLLWPDLLRWMRILRGLRVPGWRHSDFAVEGWTEVETKRADGELETHRQMWLLRPVAEHDCRRCHHLPEPARPALSPEVWRDWKWMDLTGRSWATAGALR